MIAHGVPGRLTLGVALLIASACHMGERLLGHTNEPAVYMILSLPDSLDATTDSALYALLVTATSPLEAEYRGADRIGLMRVSDGASYAWRQLPRSGAVPLGRGGVALPDDGNLALLWTSSSDGGGRESLMLGETYQLHVESNGRLITGSASMPGPVAVSILAGDGTVYWNRAPHGVAYFVIVDTDDPGAIVTTDTSYTLLFNRPLSQRPSPELVRVIAMDANLTRYFTDTSVTRSGVQGAFGVFGALSRAAVPIPASMAGSVRDPARRSSGTAAMARSAMLRSPPHRPLVLSYPRLWP